MKRIATLLLAVILITISATSQNLSAYLSYSVFNTPENNPYVETYLTINGASINYKMLDNGKFQGVVDVQVLFKKGDSIVNYAKYDLNSPILDDTTVIDQNMLDIQRYGLPQGEYTIEISLRDSYSENVKLTSTDKLEIKFPDGALEFSDIELLTSFEKSDEQDILTKNGYQLKPYVFNYYPQSANKISFYTELYNTKDVLGEEPFLLTYYIRPFETEKKLDKYIFRKRENPKEVVSVLSSFDINELPSGNYLLVFEARNRNNEPIAIKEIFFQRYNPTAQYNINNLLVLNTSNTFVDGIRSRDTLDNYVRYLSPISTDMERLYAESLVETGSDEDLRKYLLNFWVERDKLSPDVAWHDYLIKVKQANKNFKSVSHEGYQTDRGRVYLQYGQPNVISEQYFEPAAYPYEIWHFYQLGDQRDKKFVFYTHDLATNDFQLIHSNAVGELNNYRWQTVIYRRTWDPNSIDDAIIPSSWGSNATQSYTQPW